MFSLISPVTYAEIVIILIVALFTWLWIRSRRPTDYPPGPRPLPILGNLHQIGDGDFLKGIRLLRASYGDVFSLSMGKFWVIFVNGADNIHELLVKKGENLLDRPPLYAFSFTQPYGIVSASGSLWKEHRTFALHKLRSFGFGKRSFEATITEELEIYLEILNDYKGRSFDIKDSINMSISNNIMSIVVGHRFDYDDPRFKYFIQLQNENFEKLELAGVITFIPWLSKIPFDPFKTRQLTKLVGKNREFNKEEVNRHKSEFDKNNIRDFIDAFLQEMANKEGDPTNTFTDEQLIIVVGELFTTGGETTSTAIRWSLLFLIRNKDVQEKMYREIEDVVGHGRLPNMSDKPNLPYTEAVIHESLRLGNIVPFGVPYHVSDDFFYKGYKFPKGAVVFTSVDSALSDDELFLNSCKFDPERFLDKDGNFQKPDKFLAFSTGRRVCLGESLARMELFLYLSSLVQRFEFSEPEGEEPPSLEGHLGITYTPPPYKIRAIQRY